MTYPSGGPSPSIGHPAAEWADRCSTYVQAKQIMMIFTISWTNLPNTWRVLYILIYIQPLHVKIFFLNPPYQFRAVERLTLLPYLRNVSGWGCPCGADGSVSISTRWNSCNLHDECLALGSAHLCAGGWAENTRTTWELLSCMRNVSCVVMVTCRQTHLSYFWLTELLPRDDFIH